MSVRTSWSVRAGRRSAEQSDQAAPDEAPLDDLLAAPADEHRRRTQVGRRRTTAVAADRMSGPPPMSPEDLERAVQKLARGLESRERHGAARREAAALESGPRKGPGAGAAQGLNRLEAMIDALSRKLEERELGTRDAARAHDDLNPAGPAAGDSASPDTSATAHGRRRTGDPGTHGGRRRHDEARAEPSGAAKAARSRPSGEAARSARAPAASAPNETISAAETSLKQTGAGRQRATAKPRAPVQQPADSAELVRLLALLEARIDSLHSLAESNRIEPVRQELLSILRQLEEMGRDGHSVSGAVDDVRTRMGDLETTFEAARNFAGDRLTAIQERMAELAERLGDPAAAPAALLDLQEAQRNVRDSQAAIRAGQAEILGKIGDVEGLVSRFVSPEDLWERLDGLRQQLQAVPAQGEIARIEAQIVQLAERLDSLPAHLADGATKRIEAQLDSVAGALADLRRLRHVGSAELEARFAEFGERLDALSRSVVEPDLSGFERKIDDLARRVDEDRRASSDVIERLDSHMAMLAGAIERQEDNASDQAILDLRATVDRMADSLAAQGPGLGAAEVERFSQVERKLEDLGRSLAATGADLRQEEIAELRGDIASLRRELKSLPGFAGGETDFGALLTTVAQGLERVQRQPPVTSRDLEDQVERIARLLEDPAQSRLALTHIETSLRAIADKLAEVPIALNQAERGEVAHSGDAGAVADVARALSDELTTLRSAAEHSDRKTRESLDAVQGTLEAVVKRMAFLEREAALDPARANDAGPADQLVAAPRRTTLEAAAAPPKATAQADRKGDPVPSGLLGRLSSTQLLRRATGGRADSFSPDLNDSEDLDDLPLEPGTDSPLNSALSGAPSSDTALMSGSRGKSAATETPAAPPELAEPPSGEPGGTEAAEAGNDFLAFARKAARAAAMEQANAEQRAHRSGMARFLGRIGGRRRALLAAALAIAVAFTAVQYLRSETGATLLAELLPNRSAPLQETEDADPAPESAPPGLQGTEPPAASAPAAPAAAGVSPDAPVSPGPVAAAPAPSAVLPDLDIALDSVAQSSPDAADVVEPEPAPVPGPLPPAPIGPDELREAASSGDPAAQFEVAARYAEGRGVPADPAAAAEWFERAAAAGLPIAQYRLGAIYENGMGVAKDLAQAQRWYRRAADAGNVRAMHNLAVLYAEGAGGPPNLNEAARLFRRAAEHGVADSQFNIAILHARGIGVPRDTIEAYKWFSVAAAAGDAEAAKRRDAVAAGMSSGDLAKAQAAAEAFEPLPVNPVANQIPADQWGPRTTSRLDPTGKLTAHVQKLLAANGFDPGPADGLRGRRTRDAVVAFQTGIGVPATGRIDAGLVKALEESAT